MRRLAAVAVAAVLAACIPEQGPMMEPGSDCLGCHGGGSGEESAKAWTVAGTWSGEGHSVWIGEVAPGTKSFTLKTNQAGNFYTREPLRFPILVAIDGVFMPPQQGIGGSGGMAYLTQAEASCNRCHGEGGGGD
jgi:hypothetical protein